MAPRVAADHIARFPGPNTGPSESGLPTLPSLTQAKLPHDSIAYEVLAQSQHSLTEAFTELADRWTNHPRVRAPPTMSPTEWKTHKSQCEDALLDDRFDYVDPHLKQVTIPDGNLADPYCFLLDQLYEKVPAALSRHSVNQPRHVESSAVPVMTADGDSVLVGLNIEGSYVTKDPNDPKNWQKVTFKLPEVSIMGQFTQDALLEEDAFGRKAGWDWGKVDTTCAPSDG
jgi:hypothetical protein